MLICWLDGFLGILPVGRFALYWKRLFRSSWFCEGCMLTLSAVLVF